MPFARKLQESQEATMSGIIGYVGNACSLEILVEGLKSMGSDGTHSAVVVFRNGCGVERYGSVGSIDELIKQLPQPFPAVSEFLGHAAWEPRCSHITGNGHSCSFGGVTVVQKGSMNNYNDLTGYLEQNGTVVAHQLPGHVVPALITSFLNKGMSVKEAISRTISMLQGHYALGIMVENEPDALYAARSRVPLIVGEANERSFFASDILPILHHTNKFIYLEEECLCKISSNDIVYFNQNDSHGKHTKCLEKAESNLTQSPSSPGNRGYYVYREIRQQPQSLLDTIAEWIENPRRLLEDQGLDTGLIARLSNVHIVACGTSYHAALIGKYLIEEYSRIPVHVETASEYRHRHPIIGKESLFISISQSGETSDTLAAQYEAQIRGARTLTICNVVDSTSAIRADHVIYTRAGVERGTTATKSFTSQLAALYLIAIGLGVMRGRITAQEGEALERHFLKIPSLIEKVMHEEPVIEVIAGRLASARHVLLFGRGLNYPVALEGAFKLKEIANLPSEAYPSGELRHSAMALIEEGVPAIFLAPTDDIFERTVSSMREIKKRGGHTIAVTDEGANMNDLADEIIKTPAAHPALTPFVNTVALQLMAYHTGLKKGCNVDNPRHLVKSVTNDDH